jgi:hypothetical protein
MSSLNEEVNSSHLDADHEQIQQENAIWPWLDTDEMADQFENYADY